MGKNGASAGTVNGGKQAEAIEIKIVPKGSYFNCGSTPYIDISKNGIKLQHHMKSSLKQGDYSAFTQPYGYNAGCCSMAYATGLSIVKGVHVEPTQFWEPTVFRRSVLKYMRKTIITRQEDTQHISMHMIGQEIW